MKKSITLTVNQDFILNHAMEEDKFALVEKIIKDIDNVMSKNAELCAFDIVPVESNFRNKSPVLHLENCLGLESWCVKHVYMYCYNEIIDKYFSRLKRKCSKPSPYDSERLSKLLNIVLLLNPDLSSLWNKKREIVLKNISEKPRELQFSKIVLSRKPKCNDAFAYRRWLLEEIFQDDTLSTNTLENLMNEELHISELASERSPNNYHSWNHRMWIINTVKKLKRLDDIGFLMIKEFGFSEKWTAKHVSDFSCFHYRQFCIKNILTIDDANWKTFESTFDTNLRKSLAHVLASNFPNDITVYACEEDLLSYTEDNIVNLLLSYSHKSCNCMTPLPICRKVEVLFHELVLNNDLLKFYKFHETLWYHRRFVVHEILQVMYDYFGLVKRNGALIKNSCLKCNVDELTQKQAKMVRYDCNRVYSSVLFKVLTSHEKTFVEDRHSDGDNYADRHIKYLKFVEGLNNVM